MTARLLQFALWWQLAWVAGIALALVQWAHWPLWWSLIVAALVPPLMQGFIIATDFAIAWVGNRRERGARLRPSRAAALYLREVADAIQVFMIDMPWRAARPLPGESLRREPPTTAAGLATGSGSSDSDDAASAPVPVVLLHGYGCNRQVWASMAQALAAQGHAIEAPDLEPPFAPIDDLVPLVRAAIARLRARTGAAQVAVVAHSMGGLVARALIRADGDDAIAQIVTIGTPHRGTIHARFGFGANARQMRRASSWLRSLEASETPATRALFTTIWSRHDTVVSPAADQTLAGARSIAVSGIGHLSLVRDPAVAATVCAVLNPGAESPALKPA